MLTMWLYLGCLGAIDDFGRCGAFWLFTLKDFVAWAAWTSLYALACRNGASGILSYADLVAASLLSGRHAQVWLYSR
jgi:hypothetical protein